MNQPARMLRTAACPLLVALAATSACSGQATDASQEAAWLITARDRFSLRYQAPDSGQARALIGHIETGLTHVEARFARQYRQPFVARVYPAREPMIERWREAWSQPNFQSACWMVVAAGWATELDVLSPRVWSTEACGHDGSNDTHVRLIVAHELVHVLHGQHNGAYGQLQSNAPWLPEGLAVFASGQWEAEYAVAARRAARDFSPTSMQELWQSAAGYGLAGSVIAFIAQRPSSGGVSPLLEARTWQDALRIAGLDEATLLAEWRAWLVAS